MSDALAQPAGGQGGGTASGLVYEDANRNGKHDHGEKGLADIRVSNGREIVKTDAQGRYQLPVGDEAIIFVVKPSGYMTAIGESSLPRFYYIHRPNGSPKYKFPGIAPTGPLPESIDFPLYPRHEPTKFKALFFGDTQVTNEAEIGYLAHDIVESLLGSDAAFGVTLGDVVGDHPPLFENLAATISQIGIPWYNVPGNHDENYDSVDDPHALESFQRTFGPRYYSFDYGLVHFLVLDDVMWKGPKPEKKGDYEAGLDEDQLQFIKNDLALLPKGQLVVPMMHIPIIEVKELPELLRILSEHPKTFSASAHYHYLEHRFLGKQEGWTGTEPHHHYINPTTCGTWWLGAFDEIGMPHATMRDGAPNGYSIITFDGDRYSIEFRPARRPADYQMNIYAPDEIEQAKAGDTEVLVNVFAGSERSKVEMRVGNDGPWTAMQKIVAKDPCYVAVKNAEEALFNKPSNKVTKAVDSAKKAAEETLLKGHEAIGDLTLVRPLRGGLVDCPHLWRATLPAKLPTGAIAIQVRTTDLFGQNYEGRRIIRIRAEPPLTEPRQ
jgi:hypothetical protein